MAVWPATAFTPDQFNIPTSDGDIIEFVGAFSEWNIFRGPETGVGGRLCYGGDVSIIQEMMDAIEEERNKELDRKIRIIGEAIEGFQHCENAEWYARTDSWDRLVPSDGEKCEWPPHRVWAHFMLWPLSHFEQGDEIEEVLREAEEDFDYEKCINSKDYIKALEEYNFHKLLAFEEKYSSPHWVGECTGDIAASNGYTALYDTSLKDRFKVDTVIRTEFPNQWGHTGYAKASSAFGDIYVPSKFLGYIGQPGSPQLMTVALQDVGGKGKKGNGFRWTCIYTH
jgi:hypothetical protein